MINLSRQPVERWQYLTSSAVLGLDRAGVGNGKSSSEANPQELLLQEISILSVYTQLGQTCIKNSHKEYCTFDDQENTCSPKAALNLRDILEGEYKGLLLEWCHIASQQQLKAPSECLPDLMDYAARHPYKERYMIQNVIGQRGLWLAEQNPAWKHLFHKEQLDEETWYTGTRLERLDYLSKLRADDPQKARHLVEESWQQESPEDRAAFVEKFSVGLSLEDETFLEACLDDKRKPVRQTAATLLSCLSDSKLCHRMTERILQLMTYNPGKKGLLKSKKPTIEVELPDINDKALLRDGADPRKSGKLGQKAIALANIIASVPLNVWNQVEPDIESLLTAVLSSDFSASFSLGLSNAAVRQHDQKWASIILKNYQIFQEKAQPAGRITIDLRGLMTCLTPEQRERVITEFSNKNSKHLELIYEFLLSCDHSWSREFSTLAFKILRQHFIKNLGNYQLRHPMIETFALRLSPTVSEDASKGWPTNSNRFTSGDEEMVHQITSILQFRQTMLKELCSGV